jgi:hypothetical protein
MIRDQIRVTCKNELLARWGIEARFYVDELNLHSAHRLTHFRVITASDDGLEAISAS